MKVEKLLLTIENIAESRIGCRAGYKTDEILFNYYPQREELGFDGNSPLTEILEKNKFQFNKIIKSAMSRKLTVGQSISCVFIEGFRFLSEEDFKGYIRMDRREEKLTLSVCGDESEGIDKIYADGSFNPDVMGSGYGGIIEKINGEREIFSRSFHGGGSNQMELLAVLDGLKRMASAEELQINTDSRYVIRGMVQWMHFWRHNDWQTAYGRSVKFAEHWQELDRLSEGKFIELKWIKGHSGHAIQNFCHELAQKSAKSREKP